MPLNFNFNTNRKDIKLGNIINDAVSPKNGLGIENQTSISANSRNSVKTEIMDFETPQTSMEVKPFNGNALTDIDPSRYYYDAVKWATQYEIKRNFIDDKYGIGECITKSELFDMLYGLIGRNYIFSKWFYCADVDYDDWRYSASQWALENGFASLEYNERNIGYFNPDSLMTRGELIKVLWQMIGCPTKDTPNVTVNSDYNDIAVAWAQSIGILTGDNFGNLNLDKPLTQEQAATFIYRFNQKFNVMPRSTFPFSPSFNTIYSSTKYGGNQSDIQYLVENRLMYDLAYSYDKLNETDKRNLYILMGGNTSDLHSLPELKKIKSYFDNYGTLTFENKLDLAQLLNIDLSSLCITNPIDKLKEKDIQIIDEYIKYHWCILQNRNNYAIYTSYYSKTTQIIDCIKKYYPNATDIDIKNIACLYAEKGCGYMAFANILTNFIADMENGEKIFKENFGYDLCFRDYLGNASYNMETIAMDFFLYYHYNAKAKCTSPEILRKKVTGTYIFGNNDYWSITDAARAYCEERGIICNGSSVELKKGKANEELKNLVDKNKDKYMMVLSNLFDLKGLDAIDINYNYDSALQGATLNGHDYIDVGSHYVTITDVDNQGNIIVSSWSKKFAFETTEKTKWTDFTTFDFKLK